MNSTISSASHWLMTLATICSLAGVGCSGAAADDESSDEAASKTSRVEAYEVTYDGRSVFALRPTGKGGDKVADEIGVTPRETSTSEGTAFADGSEGFNINLFWLTGPNYRAIKISTPYCTVSTDHPGVTCKAPSGVPGLWIQSSGGDDIVRIDGIDTKTLNFVSIDCGKGLDQVTGWASTAPVYASKTCEFNQL